MNTLFISRLNGVFILNTLLELHTPVTVSELTGIINRRYDHVTACLLYTSPSPRDTR